ncbi:MAG TPA: TIM barrel protein, partial [Paraburkholderia sp.]
CGRTVMIEPLNALDRPSYLLNTQRQALKVIEVLGRDNLKIMLDIFHLQRGEGNLIERLRNSISHTAHVQIADNPGRHEPGTGEINFARVFSALRDSGYVGWVGCEFFASGAIDDSLQWLSDLGALHARSSEGPAKQMA